MVMHPESSFKYYPIGKSSSAHDAAISTQSVHEVHICSDGKYRVYML